MPATTTVELELLDIRTVSQMGHGHPATIRARIRRGSIPAYRSGGKFKIRRKDLPRLTKPVGAAARPTEDSPAVSGDTADLVEQIVSRFPRFTEDQKREIGRLLGEGS